MYFLHTGHFPIFLFLSLPSPILSLSVSLQEILQIAYHTSPNEKFRPSEYKSLLLALETSSFSVLPEPFFHFLGRSVFTLSQARVRHQFPYLQTGTSHTLISAFLPGPLPRMGLDYSRFPPHF